MQKKFSPVSYTHLYYGIPARYVEGYLITPQDVEGKQAGDTIEIPGTNGHAWTEIYVDGLGWIPLEMTRCV